MNVKLLVAAFLALVSTISTPGAAAAAEPVELGYPNISVAIGESRHEWVEIRTSEPEHDADVVLRFDATVIRSIAKVTTTTQGCVTAASVITCHRTMDVDQGSGSLALVLVTGQGQAGTGQITITASVNGKSLGPVHSTVTVVHPAKLVLVGAKVKAPGKTRVGITVGIKNVGKGTAHFPPFAPNEASMAHYITFPAGITYAAFVGGNCFPWGPYPEGWGWDHPTGPSWSYVCYSGDIGPGAATMVHLEMVIDPKHPLLTGYIQLRNSTERVPIVIDTRQQQETLPVTGVRVRDVGIVAFTLIVPGVILLLFTRRTWRSRRTD